MSNTPFPHRFLARREPGNWRAENGVRNVRVWRAFGWRLSGLGGRLRREPEHPPGHTPIRRVSTDRGARYATRDESWPNGTPCWIDVMVTDPAAAKAFYSGLFGWDIQDGPPQAGGHLMCMLNGRPVAAISPKPEENPFPNVWSTYLAADDLNSTVAKAKEAGDHKGVGVYNEPGAWCGTS